MNFASKLLRISLGLIGAAGLSACGVLPISPHPQPPEQRPAELEKYYDHSMSYKTFRSEEIKDKIHYKIVRYYVDTDAGPITIDHYARRVKSDSLIFVFPLLGGKNVIADYFAEYFAKNGYDTAIVHRNNDFKDPAQFENIEELLRKNVVRDRIAIDFFEKELGKKEFGSFGISRGAINVAITAGADARLKYNVLAMGGTDIVSIFKNSTQSRMKLYREAVTARKQISSQEFFKQLREKLRTSPEYLVKYMDPQNTPLALSVADTTVPFKYGYKLRHQMNDPKTILLLADHYTSILYTQYAPLLPPFRSIGIFPFDYIESEAMALYNRGFKGQRNSLRLVPYRILQLPFTLLAEAIDGILSPRRKDSEPSAK